MSQINIANSAGRDALVATQSVREARSVRWLDELQRQASAIRVVKSTIDCDQEALLERYGDLASLSQALIDGDPEIDMEMTGRVLKDASRVYITPKRKIVHKIQCFDILLNPDGSMRERRPQKVLEANLGGEQPLRWSGVFIKKADACRKFVFSGKLQLQHTNGLTYDFLYVMAKELQEKDSLLLLGAGAKSREPLILRRGGTPYRGFLEGRIEGELYSLVLHFSNLELKTPSAGSPS